MIDQSHRFHGYLRALIVGLAIALSFTVPAAHAADPVTVVILATPSADGAQARKEYSDKVNPLGAKAGIEIIKGVAVGGSLIGDQDYASVFLLGFASDDAAKDFFSSDEYLALVPLRDAGFDRYDVLIGQ